MWFRITTREKDVGAEGRCGWTGGRQDQLRAAHASDRQVELVERESERWNKQRNERERERERNEGGRSGWTAESKGESTDNNTHSSNDIQLNLLAAKNTVTQLFKGFKKASLFHLLLDLNID